MAMNVLQSPSRPGLGKVSGFFWRNPGLGLFLLLLGPLMWFGIVYWLAADAVMAGLLYL